MDFSYLLELAKDNDKFNKKEAAVSRFSTKVSRPKKVERPTPKLEAIQAVLSRKEELKQKENEEARRKKENLLALRAQDRKSNQRVKAMINRNKGASKSVLDDAKDITTAKGEEQCDEDDYGYESTMSQTIFSKLANQYANMPEDDKLRFVKASTKGSIADIKSRVISTLKKEEEDELAPRKRKRKSKQVTEDDDFINDGDAYDGASIKSELKPTTSSSSQKVVNINFTNYKSDKFNNFKYDGDKEKKKDKDDNREKKKNRDDYKEKKRDREDNIEKKRDREDNIEKKRDREDNIEKVREIEDFNEKKSKKHKEKKPRPTAPPPMSFEELLRVAQMKQSEPLPYLKEKVKEKPQKDLGRLLTAKEKEELEDERRRKLKRLGKLPQDKIEVEKPKEKEQKADLEDSKKIRKNGEKIIKKENITKLQQALEKPKPEPKVIDRLKYFATAGQKPREPPQLKEIKPQQNSKPPATKTQTSSSKDFTPKDIKPPKSRDFPPKDMKPPKSPKIPQKSKVRDFPPSSMPKRPAFNPPPKMRIASDSEEEEDDSDMDDFIDDGDQGIDISSEIRSLFGYDKRKYQDDDDDCDDMEASFSQMQKEERISAKIGLKEDLEDIQREEDERKRKIMRMKQLKKSRR